MYFIYSALLGLVLLLSFPYWLFQMVRHDKYRNGLWERFGKVPSRLRDIHGPTIWVHAVSVGEVLAVASLVEELKRRLPQYRVVVSTTTDTGQKLARARFGADNVFYFPLDFAFAIRPYLQTVRPSLIALVETELWPNFVRLAHESSAKMMVVNARISDRSLPGYLRWRRLLHTVLAEVDLFIAQTLEDRNRLVAIGVDQDKVEVSGNLKFDVAVPAAAPIVDRLRVAVSAEGPVLVCGSTVEGEELLLINTFRSVLASHPRAVMVLAPRHPERFNDVAGLLEVTGTPFWRRSQWNGEALCGGVFLLDSIGELASVYALADVAFVGGSLVPRGGHNIIEPAQHGVAIVVGPHVENFRDIVGMFERHNAVRTAVPSDLPHVLMELLADPALRHALGRSAAETWRTQTGATARTVTALERLLHHAHRQHKVPEAERTSSLS